jgi:hypothetical protein
VTPRSRIAPCFAAFVACVGISACGGTDAGDPIPPGKASAMERQLDAVQKAVDSGACEDVGPTVNALQATIGTLGASGVGEDVQDALADGADNLRGLAVSECSPEQDEETETTPTETVPTETVPPPTETTPTPPPTTPTTTTPPATTPTTTTPAPVPDEGDGDGQFDPGDGTATPPGQLKKGKEE